MTEIEKPLDSRHTWFIDQARGIPQDPRHASLLGARVVEGASPFMPTETSQQCSGYGGPLTYPVPSVETQYRFSPSEGPTGLPAFQSPESILGGGDGRPPGLNGQDLADWRAMMRRVLARIRAGEIRLWDHGLGLLPIRYRWLAIAQPQTNPAERFANYGAAEVFNLEDPAELLDRPLSLTPFLPRWGAFGSIGPLTLIEKAAKEDDFVGNYSNPARPQLDNKAFVTVLTGHLIAEPVRWLMRGRAYLDPAYPAPRTSSGTMTYQAPTPVILSLGDPQLPLGCCTIQDAPYFRPSDYTTPLLPDWSWTTTVIIRAQSLWVKAGVIKRVTSLTTRCVVTLEQDSALWFPEGVLPFNNKYSSGVVSPLATATPGTLSSDASNKARKAGIWLTIADPATNPAVNAIWAVQSIESSGGGLVVTLQGGTLPYLLPGRSVSFALALDSPATVLAWANPIDLQAIRPVYNYPSNLYSRYWKSLEDPLGMVTYRGVVSYADGVNLPFSQGFPRHNWAPILQDSPGKVPVVALWSKNRRHKEYPSSGEADQFVVSTVPPWLVADPTRSQGGGCWSAVPFRPAIEPDVPVPGARRTYSVIWEEVLEGCLTTIIPISRARTPLQQLQETLNYAATNRLGMTELERDLLPVEVTFHDRKAGRRIFADPWQLLADGKMTDRAVRLTVVANDHPLTAEQLGQLPGYIYEEVRPYPPAPSQISVGIARALFPDGYCGGYLPLGTSSGVPYSFSFNEGGGSSTTARGRPAYYRLGLACSPETSPYQTNKLYSAMRANNLPWWVYLFESSKTPYVTTFSSSNPQGINDGYANIATSTESGGESSYSPALITVNGVVFPPRGNSLGAIQDLVGLTATVAVPLAGALATGNYSNTAGVFSIYAPDPVIGGNPGEAGSVSQTTVTRDGVTTTSRSTFTPGPANYISANYNTFSYTTSGYSPSPNGGVYSPETTYRNDTQVYTVGGGVIRAFFAGQRIGGVSYTASYGSASISLTQNQLSGFTVYVEGSATGSGNMGARASGSAQQGALTTDSGYLSNQSSSHEVVYTEASSVGAYLSFPAPEGAPAPSAASGSASRGVNAQAPVGGGGGGYESAGQSGPYTLPPVGWDYLVQPLLDTQSSSTFNSWTYKVQAGMPQGGEVEYQATAGSTTVFRNSTRVAAAAILPTSQEGGRWCTDPSTMPYDILQTGRPDSLVRVKAAEAVLVATDSLTGRAVQTFILAPDKSYQLRHACGGVLRVISANQGDLQDATAYRATTLGPDILTVRDRHHGVVGYCNVLVLPGGCGPILQEGRLTFPDTNPDVSATVVTALERLTPSSLVDRTWIFPPVTYPAGPWHVLTRFYSDFPGPYLSWLDVTRTFQKTIQLRVQDTYPFDRLDDHQLTASPRFRPRVYDTRSLTVVTDYDDQWTEVQNGMWRTSSQALQDRAAIGRVTVVIHDTLTGAIL